MGTTLPYCFSNSAISGERSSTMSRYRCGPPAPLMPKRSCPELADTSAARRAGISRCGIWSTLALTPFFAPQSRTNWSNHLSYAGTKWLHWMTRSSLSAATALRTKTNGAAALDERNAAPAPTPADFRNLRREVLTMERSTLTRLPFLMLDPPPRGFSLLKVGAASRHGAQGGCREQIYRIATEIDTFAQMYP